MAKKKRPSKSKMVREIIDLWLEPGKLCIIGEAISSCAIEGIKSPSLCEIYNATRSMDIERLKQFSDIDLYNFWKGFCDETD